MPLTFETIIKVPGLKQYKIYERDVEGKLILNKTCTLEEFHDLVKTTSTQPDFIFSDGISIYGTEEELKLQKQNLEVTIASIKEKIRQKELVLDKKDYFDVNMIDPSIFDSLGFLYNKNEKRLSLVVVNDIDADKIITIIAGSIPNPKYVKESDAPYILRTDYYNKTFYNKVSIITKNRKGPISSTIKHAPTNSKEIPVRFDKEPQEANLKTVCLVDPKHYIPVYVIKTNKKIPAGTELCLDLTLLHNNFDYTFTSDYIDPKSGHLLHAGKEYFSFRTIIEEGQYDKDKQGFWVQPCRQTIINDNQFELPYFDIEKSILIDKTTLQDLEKRFPHPSQLLAELSNISQSKNVLNIHTNGYYFLMHVVNPDEVLIPYLNGVNKKRLLDNINHYIQLSSLQETVFKDVKNFEKDHFKIIKNLLPPKKPIVIPSSFFQSDPSEQLETKRIRFKQAFVSAYNVGKFDDAIAWVSVYLQTWPKDYNAKWNLVCAYNNNKQYTEAYDEVVELVELLFDLLDKNKKCINALINKKEKAEEKNKLEKENEEIDKLLIKCNTMIDNIKDKAEIVSNLNQNQKN